MLKFRKNYLKIGILILIFVFGFCCGNSKVSASDIYMYRECSNTEYYDYTNDNILYSSGLQTGGKVVITIRYDLGLDFYWIKGTSVKLLYSAEKKEEYSTNTWFDWTDVENSEDYYNKCPAKIIINTDVSTSGSTLNIFSGVVEPDASSKLLDIETGDFKYLIFKRGDTYSFSYNSVGKFSKYINLEASDADKEYDLNVSYFLKNYSSITKNFWDVDTLDVHANGVAYLIYYLGNFFGNENGVYSIYENAHSIYLLENTYLSSSNIGNLVRQAVDNGVGNFSSDVNVLTTFKNRYMLAINACNSIVNNNGDYHSFEMYSDDVLDQMSSASDYMAPYIEEIASSNDGMNNIEVIYNSILTNVGLDEGNIPSVLINAIQQDIADYIDSSTDLVDLGDEFEEYSKLFANCSYKLENSSYGANYTSRLHNIRSSYKEMLNSLGVIAIYDCEDLVGDFLEEIKIVLNAIRILVPIILILFGMIDFSQAVFAGSDDAMKKAQKRFTTRLLIAVAIFMVPTIISVLLDIAHRSWPDLISVDNCNLF